MMTYVPRAAAMPPIRALPYPFSATGTTRAPSPPAISREPSVLPLSATMTSPSIPFSRIARQAFSTQVAMVSASFKQGITTDSSVMRVSRAAPLPLEIHHVPERQSEAAERVWLEERRTEGLRKNLLPLGERARVTAAV